MSLKTAADDRRQFYERHLAGETYAEIAATAGVSVGCVRYWCRRLRDGGSCVSHYHRPAAGLLGRFDALVRYGILRLRLQHPRWGPARILYWLKEQPALKRTKPRLPGTAQIGRYLHQWPRLRRRRRPPAVVHAPQRPLAPTRVHECWQIDFKMGLPLGDGTQANLHAICDPVGEVCLLARLTPAGQQGRQPRRVTTAELQETIRQAAALWHTLPEQVQTDSEGVFVGRAEDAFPSPFTLWLAGLGVQHRTIRPGQPTDNAAVERCHQTISNYAVVGHEKANLAQLAAVLAAAVAELACDLPCRAAGCHGQPPVVAHPELLQPRQLWLPEHEWASFDPKRVANYLASLLWQRQVDQNGQIYLGGRHVRYSVGQAYQGQTVYVCFDAEAGQFVFFQAQPPYAEINRKPAKHLDTATLTGLAQPSPHGLPQQLPLFARSEG